MISARQTNKRSISFRQLHTIDLWLKCGRKSKARALREAGYSEAVIKQPHKVFSSSAVREELNKRGLGYDGLRDNLTPHVKPVPVYREHVDFSAIPKETLLNLKEKLREIGYESTPILINDLHQKEQGLFCR